MFDNLQEFDTQLAKQAKSNSLSDTQHLLAKAPRGWAKLQTLLLDDLLL